MDRIEAAEMVGPRAYFTTFDDRLLERSSLDSLCREAERKLKVLLLTKQEIVCAASHLASPVAYRILRDNPVLLTSGALTPALREDRASVGEAVVAAATPGADLDEMITFYEDNVARTVAWSLDTNAEWFRAAVLRELGDIKSVLRSNLRSVDDNLASMMRERIAGAEGSLRDVMAEIAESLADDDRAAFLAMRELLYHMSGARVVNCESSLPQENFVDYGLADLESHQTVMSDLQVFSKLFVETVYRSMKGRPLSVELIDILTFSDVLSLREGAFDHAFVGAYDELTAAAARVFAVDETDLLLLDVDQLMTLREQLASRIEASVQTELQSYAKMKSIGRTAKVVLPAAGIAATLAGLTAGLAVPAAMAGLAITTPAFVFNLYGAIRDDQSLRNAVLELDQKKRVAVGAVSRLTGAQRSPLISAIVEASARAAENLAL